MARRYALLAVLGCVLAGCANPINRATHDRYVQQGRDAEARGDWRTMEMAYYRAAVNVRRGFLGERLEGEALFNLGRAKRLVGKLDESEDLLKRSLAIEEKLYGRDGLPITITLAELAMTYFEAGKHGEGIPVLVRLEPMALKERQNYSEQGRAFIAQLYELYAVELLKMGQADDGERFKKAAESLK